MSPATRARVRKRARNRCEYCQLKQEDSPLAQLHVEHIIPRVHGGGDELSNLALACIDPETRQITELFHPRRHRWKEHFEWRGIYVFGRTRVGRATVQVLNMNSEEQL